MQVHADFFSFVKLNLDFQGQIPYCESLVGNYPSNTRSQCRDKERRWTLLVLTDFLDVIPDVLKCTFCFSLLNVSTCILWGKDVSMGMTVNRESVFLDNNFKETSYCCEETGRSK